MIHLYLRSKTGNISREVLIFAFCPNLHATNANRMDRMMKESDFLITSNDLSLGCPIICTDIFHNAILFSDTSSNAQYNQAYWLIRTPYLSISASNAQVKLPK